MLKTSFIVTRSRVIKLPAQGHKDIAERMAGDRRASKRK